MNLFKNDTRTTLSLLLALSFAIFTSCDNPAASGGEHHHEEHAVGAALFMNGEHIAEYHDHHVHGQITVAEGKKTALITIKFIAEDGDLFQPHESHHFLGWKVTNPAIAEVVQYTDDGTWKFHIIGKKAGETEVVLKMMHGEGEAAHPHLTTAPIPIVVNAN